MSGSVQMSPAGSGGRSARRAGSLVGLVAVLLGPTVWSAGSAVADTPAPVPTLVLARSERRANRGSNCTERAGANAR